MLFVVLIFGCSKSEDNNSIENTVSVDLDYTIVIQKEDALHSALLNANLETISINTDSENFLNIQLPQITYTDGNELGSYSTLSNCNGFLNFYNFNTNNLINLEVFHDLDACELEVAAIAHNLNMFFIAYEIPSTTKDNFFYIRIIDTNNADHDTNFTDIALDKKPLQLSFSGDNLFILLLDKDETEDYSLAILDRTTKQLIHQKNLGPNVQKIIKNTSGDILVTYPKLHTIINKSTFSVISEVRYLDGKEPKIGYSDNSYFAGNRLFYSMQTEFSPSYSKIPAVYDFSTNTAILYLYENLLTLEEREFEFKIEDTTMVSYDSKNDLILVGYKKKNNANLGGLLRIKPSPNLKFIDNTDLPGVPYTIFFN